jgi:hypothetical protein
MEINKSVTAVEWLIIQIKNDHTQKVLTGLEWMRIFEQAKAMEKEQIIDIVEKSRATGLTAEYLLLTYGQEGGEQ